MVDTSKLKVGDVVQVRPMTVREIFLERDEIVVSDDRDWCTYLKSESIVHVEPPPLKVGDRVRGIGSGSLGSIIAIHNECVWWLVDGNTYPKTERITFLERAE